MVAAQIRGSEDIVHKWLGSGYVLMFKSKGSLDRSDGDFERKRGARDVPQACGLSHY